MQGIDKQGTSERNFAYSSARLASSQSSAKTICMDAAEIERSLTRIAHQILENNHGTQGIALVGIVTRGDLLAKRLADKIADIEHVRVPLGALDISFYRDDFATYISPEVLSTDIPFDINGKTIVLVDDVLFTGRTIRAALDALMDIGRPACVQLAVLVDRGHRQLPIRADYVGKNVPSSGNESVRLYLEETDGVTSVDIFEIAPGERAGSAPLARKNFDGQGGQGRGGHTQSPRAQGEHTQSSQEQSGQPQDTHTQGSTTL